MLPRMTEAATPYHHYKGVATMRVEIAFAHAHPLLCQVRDIVSRAFLAI